MKSFGIERIKDELASLYYYSRIRYPKQWGMPSTDEYSLIEAFRRSEIELNECLIDVEKYEKYVQKAGYAELFSDYYAHNIVEKSFEHFIAQQFLQLKKTDIYVDIASEGSPVPEIYHRLYGCTTYAQDISYPFGLIGNRIGSNAEFITLPDESVTKMALHCSLEHFEGESDSGFIREAARILKTGGKIVIVPLYLATEYSILTDPFFVRSNHIQYDRDAMVCCVKGWNNRHGRFYDLAHLSSRVLQSSQRMKFELFHLCNPKDIGESVYARFVLVGTKVSQS